MLQLAVFISGKGSNLRAIHRAILEGRLDASLRLVVSNTPAAGGLQYAQENSISTAVIRAGEEHTMLSTLQDNGITFIALAGFLKLIPPDVIAAYRNRILNIHPALLPSFGGKGMYGMNVHRAVIESGAKYSGPTVHIVSEEYDRGPIVLQRTVSVDDDDTPEGLAAKVLVLEHSIFPEALQLFASNRIQVHNLRTFIT